MEHLEIDKEIVTSVLDAIECPSVWFRDLDKSRMYWCISGSPKSEKVNLIELINNEWTQREFSPSTNIQDAWLIFEVFDFANIERIAGYGELYKVTVSISEIDGTYSDVEAKADTFPLSICKASLRTRGILI